MEATDLTSSDDLLTMLQEVESWAPTRDRITGTRVNYRVVMADEVIDDSEPPDEITPEPPLEQISYVSSDGIPKDRSYDQQDGAEAEAICDMLRVEAAVPIVAVDCGIARLGETENGLVIALRATIVSSVNNQSEIDLFRTGPIYLHNAHKLEILYRMGQQLGKSDQFVEVDDSDLDSPRPVRVKSGVAHDAHKYGDRFRNWFERMIQKRAVTRIRNGILLLDGALTLRTLDTPDIFFERLAESASQNGNAIIAISKQSMLQVHNKPVRFWLNDAPSRVCYRCLSPLMNREENERVMGNAYAVRLSALGPTFRMDVKAVEGQSDDEAINLFWNSALIRGGYPDILVRAHTHSYFTSPDVIELQAQAGAKYQLIPQSEPDLSGIFGPFGGRYK